MKIIAQYINILPIISKIFERSVFNQLYEFLNTNNLLSKHQFGFRRKYSTLVALIQMFDAWYENMDNGELNGVVFIDIRKPFDSINHNILLPKMKEQFGISNIELKLFESYLSDREQVSFVNGAMSAAKRIVCGVPQESILGPLLFLSPSRRREVPCEGTNSPRLLTPGETKSKVNQ